MQIQNLVSLLPRQKVQVSEISTTADLPRRDANFIEKFQNRKTLASPLCWNIVAEFEEAKKFCSPLPKRLVPCIPNGTSWTGKRIGIQNAPAPRVVSDASGAVQN